MYYYSFITIVSDSVSVSNVGIHHYLLYCTNFEYPNLPIAVKIILFIYILERKHNKISQKFYLKCLKCFLYFAGNVSNLSLRGLQQNVGEMIKQLQATTFRPQPNFDANKEDEQHRALLDSCLLFDHSITTSLSQQLTFFLFMSKLQSVRTNQHG